MFSKTPAIRSTRRGLWLALVALMLTMVGGCASLVPASTCTRDALAYVGSEEGRLVALRLDACSGRLRSAGAVADVPRPRWAVSAPQGDMLYVASDAPDQDGRVVAFKVDRASGALQELNAQAAGGSGTTHLWLDAPSRTLFAANFGSGSVSSFALEADGRLGPLVSTLKATGSGPHKRQSKAHAHGVVVDPSGHYVLAPDLGADRVFVYAFDRASRVLSSDTAQPPRAFAAPAGSGPHHVAFGADGRFVYLLNELSADITTLRWDAREGRLASVQLLPISRADFNGAKSGAELAMSHDGRFVYVADRGTNELLVYRVDAGTGELAPIQRLSSGGVAPWTFALDPSGRWLLVVNARSNLVNLFGIDAASGQLSDTGQSVAVPAPLSVTFIE